MPTPSHGRKRSLSGKVGTPRPNNGGFREGAGRPTVYEPSYCELVVETMRDGLSLTGFAGRIGVARQTILNWQQAHPAFAEACAIGKAVRCSTWEDIAVHVARNGGGPGSAVIVTFALKNMAPEEYADTQNLHHAGPNGGPIQMEAITNRQRAVALAAFIAKTKAEQAN